MLFKCKLCKTPRLTQTQHIFILLSKLQHQVYTIHHTNIHMYSLVNILPLKRKDVSQSICVFILYLLWNGRIHWAQIIRKDNTGKKKEGSFIKQSSKVCFPISWFGNHWPIYFIKIMAVAPLRNSKLYAGISMIPEIWILANFLFMEKQFCV